MNTSPDYLPELLALLEGRLPMERELELRRRLHAAGLDHLLDHAQACALEASELYAARLLGPDRPATATVNLLDEDLDPDLALAAKHINPAKPDA